MQYSAHTEINHELNVIISGIFPLLKKNVFNEIFFIVGKC